MSYQRDSIDSSVFAKSEEQLLRRDSVDTTWSTGERMTSRRIKHTIRICLVASLFLNAAQFAVISTSAWTQLCLPQLEATKDPWTLTYSPAHDAVEYEVKHFTAGFSNETTMYMNNGSTPTDELDRAWAELYKPWGFVRIPREQAAQLTESTAPIPGDEDHYLVGIDVFHQLHCLDNIRRSFWPERYNVIEHGQEHMEHRSPRHLDHCVDSLRQAIMCQSDISTLHFDWSQSRHENLVVSKTTHTCRNFEKIREWTMDKNMLGWDPKTFIPDPLRDVSEFLS